MYFSNGFVYGGTPTELMKVIKVKPLDNMMLLLTFNKYLCIQSLIMVYLHGLLAKLISLLNQCMRTAIHM